MKMPWTMSWNQVLISLLIGFVAGSFYTDWRREHHFGMQGGMHCRGGKDMKQFMVKRFTRELHLSPDQSQKVEAVFEKRRPQMTALSKEMRPKFEALRSETQAEIRPILTPDQQKKFDEMNRRMEEKWEKRREAFEK